LKEGEGAKADDVPKDEPESVPLGLNLGNYSADDIQSLTQITQEMNRRMKMARGMKRGRKVQGFSEYCEKTQERINELKAILKRESTSEE